MLVTDTKQLRVPCKDVRPEQVKEIISKLEAELAQHKNGIGLSANQIGIDAKVAIIRIPKKEKIDLINPKIIEHSGEIVFYKEGCLSLPDQKKEITTQRYEQITIENGFDRAKYVLYGIEAIVAQHEIGHLEGRLMLDEKAQPYQRPERKLGRNERCKVCGMKYKKHANSNHGFVPKGEND